MNFLKKDSFLISNNSSDTEYLNYVIDIFLSHMEINEVFQYHLVLSRNKNKLRT